MTHNKASSRIVLRVAHISMVPLDMTTFTPSGS